ncbi:phosphate-starvation-inducible PsiE family protein [Eubacterium sp.]|uniref:phosphate-starvation-inducible PsiE family protein n=1 Tax=Eubacterium sp. TaxID=142586 RepID=UPI0015AA209F|nr:phosphate-starvation-inducible PsiE family protein [uncultured Eubacterium sp.]
MGTKIRRMIDRASELLELAINIIIIIAVIVAVISLWKPFMEFVQNRESAHAFLDFLGYVLNVLIGIEFFKMLCKPDVDTILEVVMFVIVRHMVVLETSTVENLLTIVGMAIIFAIKKFLKEPKSETKKKINSDESKIRKEND